MNLKCTCTCDIPRIGIRVFKQNKIDGLILSNFKIYYKPVVKTVCTDIKDKIHKP